jgi:hypothetical protein
MEEINRHGLVYKKRLIGAFMGDVYRELPFVAADSVT